MSFKTELHLHTSDFSPCARQNGAEAADFYIDAGYSTVVVANHFTANFSDSGDFVPFVRRFFRAGEIMREAAGDRLTVLTGMELRFKDSINDYLVFGMIEEMLLTLPQIFDMGIGEFHAWAMDHGVLVIQAHPFRLGMKIVDHGCIDGAEVFNGEAGDVANDTAEFWAKRCAFEHPGFILTSGSDHHRADQPAVGGIETEAPITTMDELCEVLRSGEYTILRG